MYRGNVLVEASQKLNLALDPLTGHFIRNQVPVRRHLKERPVRVSS